MAKTGKWVALPILLCLLFILSSSSKYQPVEIEIIDEPNGEPTRIFTAEQLLEFDGSDESKSLLMAVRGVVFDVSQGKDFYGKGAGYHALAGKDCTRAIALWSLEAEECSHDLTGLSDKTLESLDEVYLGTYKKKYPVVGYMDFILDTHAEKFRERFREDL